MKSYLLSLTCNLIYAHQNSQVLFCNITQNDLFPALGTNTRATTPITAGMLIELPSPIVPELESWSNDQERQGIP